MKLYQSLTLEEFLEDDIAQDVVEYNIFICINLMVDITNQIVIDLQLGEIDYLRDGFKHLRANNYISVEEETAFSKMVEFRNTIAYEYLTLDKKVVYNILQNYLKDIQSFLKIVTSKISLIYKFH